MSQVKNSLSKVTRRDFLRTCGVMGFGLAAVVSLPAGAAANICLGRAGIAVTRTLPLMGTFVTITAVHESVDLGEEAVGKAFQEMERLMRVFDRHRGDSAVSVLNCDGRLSGSPPELGEVLERAKSIHELSGGAFDPTVAPLLDVLRGRADEGLSLDIAPGEIADLLALVDATKVGVQDDRITLLRQGMALTFDGIAKGYIVDRASSVLSASGVYDHLVNAGGDIRVSGKKRPGQQWTVAVEDPDKGGRYPDVISLRNGAIATSGSYEASFDRRRFHHHVVTPGTGRSPQSVVSVSILAPTAMEADALATAVMVMEPRAGLALVDSLPGREGFIITAAGAQMSSRHWG